MEPNEFFVPKSIGCPNCGECDMDKLVWFDDESEFVRCQTCQFEYEPFKAGNNAASVLEIMLCANSKTT